MLQPQISSLFHITVLYCCILAKVSINSMTYSLINKNAFHPLFQEKITFLA